MDLLHSPTFINIIWIGTAFIFGFAMRRIGLPPMIGFLASGFALNFLGLTDGSLALESIADMGIMLLLFTIGLKLDLKSLIKPEIWLGTNLHILLSVLFFSIIIMLAGTFGIASLTGLDLWQTALIGFALSFSSTVFAVKVLEDKGEMTSKHGQVAIGILIMQDIVAVIFLTLSKGEFPSLWALGLPIFLLLIRPVLRYLINHAGHGEMLTLGGLFVAIVVGATSFHLVGLKPDLGALIMGVLVGSHPRASELGKSLYSFKDMFLVGFFFQIGLSGIPTLTHVFIALGFLSVLAVKSGFYFLLLSRFKLRARTSMLATLSLSNYSEFGLLVAAISAQKGWLDPEWLIILSLALTFSFILASPLNSKAHCIYDRFSGFLHGFERKTRHADDVDVDLGDASILVFGMGRIGTGAYEATRERHGNKVLGVDYSEKKVEKHLQQGRRVISGDATDFDFWQATNLDKVRLIMLAMPKHQANMFALEELQKSEFHGMITATARFDDEREELIQAGATAAYNIFSEAGAGYADHVCQSVNLK